MYRAVYRSEERRVGKDADSVDLGGRREHHRYQGSREIDGQGGKDG